MNTFTNILMNIGFSITATGIWGLIALFLYHKEKKSRRNVAYFRLNMGLDRLKDCLNEIHDLMNKSSSHNNNFYGLVKQSEKKLERYASAISYDNIIAHNLVSYKSKKGEIIWMYDLLYILDSCQEMVNELFDLSIAIKEKGLEKDANQYIESLSSVTRDVLSAIEQETNLVPDKYKNLDMNKN
jgi:hypothetical protein